MSTQIDTNILTRAAQPHHVMYQLAVDAMASLRQRGEALLLVPQNFYEFWVVGTRPVAQNGLGLSPVQLQAEFGILRSLFVVLNDTPGIYAEWERLGVANQVVGKSAHDARLVAAMIVHGIGQILTFNTADFARYSGIKVIAPKDVLGLPTGP